jgi:FkbM family methyltransferase
MTGVAILESVAAALPLRLYDPLRHGAVRLRRNTLPRSACVAVLQVAMRAWRGRLGRHMAEIRPLDAPHLAFAATDSMVVDTIYWLGVRGYEGKVADVWVELCRASAAVLEIGGNVGLFTVLGRRASQGTYTVVEPVPSVAAVLGDNLARNGLDTVEVLEAAAIPGDVARGVMLSIPDEGRTAPVGAHLLEGVEVSGRHMLNQITVRGLPAAQLMAGRDLIKIDAEGIEAMLLQSAWAILVAQRPTLMIEVLPEADALGRAIAALAQEAKYTIAVIPEYGREDIVVVAPEDFNAQLPQRYNSKDVVLSARGAPCGNRTAF